MQGDSHERSDDFIAETSVAKVQCLSVGLWQSPPCLLLVHDLKVGTGRFEVLSERVLNSSAEAGFRSSE